MSEDSLLKKERIYDSVITLGNSIEIGIQVMRELMGDESYNNSSVNNINNEQISSMLQNSIQENLKRIDIEDSKVSANPEYSFN